MSSSWSYPTVQYQSSSWCAPWSHILSKMLTGLQLLCGNQMLHRATTNMSRWWEALKFRLRSQMLIVWGFLMCVKKAGLMATTVFHLSLCITSCKTKVYVLRLTYCRVESPCRSHGLSVSSLSSNGSYLSYSQMCCFHYFQLPTNLV